MCDGHYQFDMTRALAAYLLLSNLNTASVTNDALIAYSLIFTAMTFIILSRTENTLAEETVTLWLVRTVIDCFRLQHLTTAILQYFFWRSEADGDFGEVILYFCIFLKSHCLEIIKGSRLIKFDTQTKTTEFVEKYVE